MFQNNNSAVPKRLAQRSLHTDRRRNLITVIAIALTTLLFTSVLTMGSGSVESIQRATMAMVGGDGHASVKYVTDEEFKKIKRNPLVKEMAYCRMLCDSVDNSSLIKRHTEFWYYDNTGLKFGFAEPTGGHRPSAENEVIADTKTLELMGIPLKVGSPIKLELTVHGKQVQRDFVLAGWWKSDPGFNVGQIFASRAYVDAHIGELQNTYYQDSSLTGAITGYIKFENSLHIENNLQTLLTQSGYSMDSNASNYIATGINWAYLSTQTSIDAPTVIGLLCAFLLFMFTGYLIIYNIFQISVLKDIRFYGLLKTIGSTNRQLRMIIRHQAILLSLTGIPIGLFSGFLVGKSFVPSLIAQSSYAGSVISVTPRPAVFLCSAAFAFITVFLSIRKPVKIAAEVSPIEAVCYTGESDTGLLKTRKTKSRANAAHMALFNLGRNRKRTLLVVLSLSLSIILANTVFTVSQSIDINKALAKFTESDFLIAHADYFNHQSGGADSALSKSFVAAVKARPGFQSGGYLYGTYGSYTSRTSKQTMNKQPDGSYSTAIYGLDPFSISRLKCIDGTIDTDRLASGNYVLEGTCTDDNGNVEADTINHSIGDVITLHCDGKDKKLTVLGHVIANPNTNTDGSWMGSVLFLPTDVFQTLTGVSYAMSYAFDVTQDQESAMETFLKEYTDSVEPTMNYSSKFTALAGLEGVRQAAVLIGGALSLIIGLIGILNFSNAILTGILTRRHEFAMLQSIGMTRKQLRSILCREGGFYAGFTAIISVFLCICCSLLIVRPLSGSIWFMHFHFVFYPLLIILPILFLLAILLPLLLYHSIDKQSLVEQLRETET